MTMGSDRENALTNPRLRDDGCEELDLPGHLHLEPSLPQEYVRVGDRLGKHEIAEAGRKELNALCTHRV